MRSKRRCSLKSGCIPRRARTVYDALDTLDSSVDFDPRLRELVKLRASQLNGCPFCVDMHSRDARAAGEDERRLWGVAAWRHHPLFDERERAALALTEAMTPLVRGGVPDSVYDVFLRAYDDLGNFTDTPTQRAMSPIPGRSTLMTSEARRSFSQSDQLM